MKGQTTERCASQARWDVHILTRRNEKTKKQKERHTNKMQSEKNYIYVVGANNKLKNLQSVYKQRHGKKRSKTTYNKQNYKDKANYVYPQWTPKLEIWICCSA